MLLEISTSTVKTKGFKFLDKFLQNKDIVYLTRKGKPKYVLLSVEDYERLKCLEIDQAVKKVIDDFNNKRFLAETADDHFKRIKI